MQDTGKIAWWQYLDQKPGQPYHIQLHRSVTVHFNHRITIGDQRDHMKALIIEDDAQIVEAISLAFRMRWPEAELVSSHLGVQGVEIVRTDNPDILILDLGLPDIHGFEVLKQVRTFSSIPIIILTVSREESSIVRGLEMGADDYVVKPFKQLELLARIRAMLRRGGADDDESPLAFGALKFDPVTRQAIYKQKDISLTPTEGRILYHLLKHPGRVVSHSSLAEAIWGSDYPGAADNMKVYIWRLREKLEQDPSHPQLILTKAGTGYYLAKPN